MIKRGEWLELQVPKDWSNHSLEHVLKSDIHIPKKQLHQLRMSKGAKINEKVMPWSSILQEGDELLIHLFIPEALGVYPTDMNLHILYEDDHVLVVNKPTGINVHPNEEGDKNTLANGVAYHYLKTGLQAKVRHIHRLDQHTTGAVIFAKHSLASATMDRLLEQRAIKRTYLALAQGKVKEQKGTISEKIGRDRHHPSRRRISPTGQKAVTNYEVVSYHGKQDVTLVKLQLQTGRTHQIRVHMAHIDHPLLGDTLYGGRKGDRQALHAAKVTFPHPISKESITCLAPFIEGDSMFSGEADHYL